MENQNLDDSKEFADAIAALGGTPAEPVTPVEPTEPAPPVAEPAEPVGEPTEPAEPQEPAGGNEPAEPSEPAQPAESAEPAEPRLYAGKYKSPEDLEKGYAELQAAFSKKSQQAKEVVENFSSPDDFDMKMAVAVDKIAVELVEEAIGGISDPEHLKEATAAIAMYKRTGDIAHIDKARDFLDKPAYARLDRDMRNAAAQVKQHFLSQRDEIEMEPIKEQLVEMHKEDPDWVMDENNQKIMDLTISLNRKVDLREVKKMIQDVGTRAVEKYKAAEAAKLAKAAAKKPNVSLGGGDRTPPPVPPKSEDEMTTAEYLAASYAKLAK